MIRFHNVVLDERAFGPVTVQFEVGRLAVLCGLSGSGKSTLCQLLCERQEPSEGRVERPEDLRLGFIAHDFVNQLVGSTVAEEVEIAQRAGGGEAVGAELETALSSLWEQLKHLAARDPQELSAVQQQCLLLFCALVAGARFLILDESLSHLDSDSAKLFTGVLKCARDAGIGILVVTHQESLLELADQVVMMEDRRLAFCGPPKEFSDDLAARAGFRSLSEPRQFEGRPRGAALCEIHHAEQSLVLSQGEMLLLGGAAGAGKSRVLNWLYGLPMSKEWRMTPQVESRCLLRQMVGPSFWRSSVQMEIEASRAAFGKVPNGLVPLLEDAIPGSWLKRSPAQLSHGQLRFFGTVCLLWQSPVLLFLDLPFQGLDGTLRLKLWGLLNRFLMEGGAFIMTSSSREWVGSESVKFVWLENGRAKEFTDCIQRPLQR